MLFFKIMQTQAGHNYELINKKYFFHFLTNWVLLTT